MTYFVQNKAQMVLIEFPKSQMPARKEKQSAERSLLRRM